MVGAGGKGGSSTGGGQDGFSIVKFSSDILPTLLCTPATHCVQVE